MVLSLACTKTKTVYQNVYVNVPIVEPANPLVNKAWVLTSIIKNDVTQPLTALQSSYYMTLYKTGLYTDSYGTAGYWNKPVNDSLKLYKNVLSNFSIESYAIDLNDSLNLVISTTVANQKTVYKYTSLGVVSTPNPATPINTTPNNVSTPFPTTYKIAGMGC